MKHYMYVWYALFAHATATSAATITTHITPVDTTTSELSVQLSLEPQEYLYKNTLDITLDNPALMLAPWRAHQEAHDYYQPDIKESQPAYSGTVTFTARITRTDSFEQHANLHVRFYTSGITGPQEKIIPLTFVGEKKISQEKQPHGPATPESDQAPRKKLFGYEEKKDFFATFSPSAYISDIVTKTDNIWIRLLLVFILGVLVSLTPCIYPMIPITVGILHAGGRGSFVGNLMRSISYTLGIATTFASFGLLASCTGPIYGYLLGNPFFVIPLVLFLLYLALSMFGLYEMYIPRFLQKKGGSSTNGSMISAFIFGAASGTISSPCAAPGLTLLLSIAATLSNPFMGFLLLFVFGFGTSMPLLLIGTFSSSLTMLPRAGLWMIEIKKIFGTLLIGMCVYYLNNIVAWPITLWLITVLSACGGVAYLYASLTTKSSFWKKIHSFTGLALIVTAMITCIHAYQATVHESTQVDSTWLTDYDKAAMVAHAHHKLLLLDIGASFCSICKEIDATILHDPLVIHALGEVVPVKIDGTNPRSEPYAQVQQEFHVTTFPTILLVDPETKEVIRRWGSELYGSESQIFAQTLHELAESHHATS